MLTSLVVALVALLLAAVAMRAVAVRVERPNDVPTIKLNLAALEWAGGRGDESDDSSEGFSAHV
jgi:hypothetical protein